jgi:hypothetical protein
VCSPVLVPVEEVHDAALHGGVGSPSWCGAGAGSWWAPNSCGDATRSMELEENACDCDMIVLAVLAVNCVTFTSVIYSHLFTSIHIIQKYNDLLEL